MEQKHSKQEDKLNLVKDTIRQLNREVEKVDFHMNFSFHDLVGSGKKLLSHFNIARPIKQTVNATFNGKFHSFICTFD